MAVRAGLSPVVRCPLLDEWQVVGIAVAVEAGRRSDIAQFRHRSMGAIEVTLMGLAVALLAGDRITDIQQLQSLPFGVGQSRLDRMALHALHALMGRGAERLLLYRVYRPLLPCTGSDGQLLVVTRQAEAIRRMIIDRRRGRIRTGRCEANEQPRGHRREGGADPPL